MQIDVENLISEGCRFLIRRELGRGGMGTVYEALDQETDTPVALKILEKAQAKEIYHFKTEFRTLQDIVHPNLCSLIELIEQKGRWFLVMDLIDGVDFLTYTTIARKESDGSLMDYGLYAGGDEGNGTDSDAATHWIGFDETRLRQALCGVARGLVALHSVGKVHRDIKPTNVIITAEGRAVLLDFGLILETLDSSNNPLELAGTPEYMAPEQIDLSQVSPPADCYSVGVMLYEALTGTLPFPGSPTKILMDKQLKTPAPPITKNPLVPHDLNQLCINLLRRDPKDRTTAEEILSILNADEQSPRAQFETIRLSLAATKPIFVGREEELRLLHRGFEDMLTGHGVTIVVEGVSGIGKTALLQKFIGELAQAQPGSVVLSGRCYERESVPFKAFDGVVDALTRHIQLLPPEKSKPLIPANAVFAARLFPIMYLIDGIRQKTMPIREMTDPVETQRMAFRAIRNMFHKISELAPLVVIIDDMQWTDSDSISLLAELLSPAVSLPMLLILLSRTLSEAEKTVLPWEEALPGDLRKISLNPLDRISAENLARLYSENLMSNLSSVNPVDIAAEAAGHPLYIAELVRSAAEGDKELLGQLKLDEVIWSRVQHLSPSSQTILEHSCVAGVPLNAEYLQEVTGILASEFNVCLSMLRTNKLLKTRGRGATARVAPFHDRVREAVLTHLVEQERAAPINLKLGRYLLEKYTKVELEKNIFQVVRYLDEASNLIVDENERNRLLQLYLDAGKSARGATAYSAAAGFYLKSLAYMGKTGWKRHYELCLKAHTAIAEAGFLLKDQELLDFHYREVVENARDLLDKLNVYEIMIQDAQSKNDLQTAVSLSIKTLAELGFSLPRNPSKVRVIWELVQTQRMLRKTNTQQILHLPQMTDPKIIGAVQISYRASHIMYAISKDLMVANSMIRLRLCLTHGYAPVSAPTFAGYAIVCCGVLRKYDLGYKYGNLALDLIEKYDLKQFRGSTIFRFNTFIRHWREPLVNSLVPLKEAYNYCLEMGDLGNASYPAFSFAYTALFSGRPIQSFLDDMDVFVEEISEIGDMYGLQIARAFRQFAENIIAKEDNHGDLEGKYFSEAEWFPLYVEDANMTSLGTAYCMKTVLCYLFEDIDGAMACTKTVKENLNGLTASYFESIYHFYDALIFMANWGELNSKEKKSALQNIKNDLKLMRRFARSCKENYEHKQRLMEAELARIRGDQASASKFYQAAIDGALQNGFMGEAALASELFAKFQLGLGNEREGEQLLSEAVAYYTAWGAYAKVAWLKKRYPVSCLSLS